MIDPTTSPADGRWHVSESDLEAYARGFATPSQAASIEPHLTVCPDCQARFATRPHAPMPQVGERLRLVLDDVLDSVDGPTPSPVERLLRRVGVPDHVAHLLDTTPRMHLPWLAAVAAVLVFTALASFADGRSAEAFLVVAPLLPLAVVAAAFALPGDQRDDLATTAPTRTSWLLLIRSVSVLAPTILLCVLAALAVPGHGWGRAAWLLPSLALSAAAAALATWIRPVVAAIALTLAWLVTLALTTDRAVRTLQGLRAAPFAEADVFAPTGQVVAVLILCASLAVLVGRREVLDAGSLA